MRVQGYVWENHGKEVDVMLDGSILAKAKNDGTLKAGHHVVGELRTSTSKEGKILRRVANIKKIGT